MIVSSRLASMRHEFLSSQNTCYIPSLNKKMSALLHATGLIKNPCFSNLQQQNDTNKVERYYYQLPQIENLSRNQASKTNAFFCSHFAFQKSYTTIYNQIDFKRDYSNMTHNPNSKMSMKINKQEKDASMDLELNVEQLKKNLELVVPSDGLEEKLRWSEQTKTPLRVKLGFDPTAPDLHLGHAVVLKKIREFQNFGHKIVIIIGDFTACIGDPTGRNKTRPPLSQEEISVNAKTYLDQLAKVIDLSRTEVHFNSEWFDKLNFRDMIQLVSKVTLSQILQREDFSNRHKQNIPIHLHELIYPIVQGYDSLMIEADVEMGGTDQLFNCLVGRDIQSIYGKKQQIVACVPILKGTDGQQKMSKSLNNYIGLAEDPHDMYGKIMSIPDNLIEEYTRLISNFSKEKFQMIHEELLKKSANPMTLKKELAYDIVQQFHGDEVARESADYFYKQVQSRDEALIEFIPITLKELKLDFSGLTLITLCTAILQDRSKGEIRRIIQGGGVSINSNKIVDPNQIINACTTEDFKLKIGKRNFYQVIVRQV